MRTAGTGARPGVSAGRTGLSLYLAVAAAVVVGDLVVVLSGLPLEVRQRTSDLLQAGGVLAVGLLVLCRARRQGGSTRRTWHWAAGAALAWSAGQSVLTVQAARGRVIHRPGLPDVAFALAVLCAMQAAAAFPTVAERGSTRGRALLDGAIVASCTLLLAWAVPLHGRLLGTTTGPALVVALAYPVLDCAILTVLLSGATRLPRAHLAALCTAAAGIATITATGIQAFAAARNHPPLPANPLEVGYLLGFALVGLGALLQGSDGSSEDRRAGRAQQLLPYVLLPPVALTVLVQGPGIGRGPLTLAVGTVALLVLRQVLVLVENADLSAQLLARGRRYEALVQGSADVIAVLEVDGTLTWPSDSLRRLLGSARPSGAGRDSWVDPGDLPALRAALAACAHGEGDQPVAFRLGGTGLRLEGWVRDVRHLPEVDGFVLNAHDVTERWQAQVALADSERRYRRIVETAREGLCEADGDDVLRFANSRLAEILNLPLEQLVGRRQRELVLPMLRDDRARALFEEQLQRRAQGESATYELPMVRPDGQLVYLHVSAAPLYDAEGRLDGNLTLVTDVTDHVELRERLQREAVTDALTGLGNRALLLREGDLALAGGGPVALLYLDLDLFKAVNDSWGHAAGDELLRAVADRFVAVVPQGAVLVRLGGDEYAALLPGRDELVALEVAQRLLDCMHEPYVVSGSSVLVSASVGVAVGQGGDLDTLTRNADLALYEAKAAGRGCARAYRTRMHEAVHRRMTLEQDLRHAVEAGQLEVHYQPVVDLSDGRCIGAEALVRWRHPRLGLLAPDAFIGIAEEGGAVVGLGTHVLRQACRDARAWEDEEGERLVVSVNVAPRQLAESDVPQLVASALSEAGLGTDRLLVEITERSLLAGSGPKQALEQLHQAGVQLALDDFGTGWSSIAHLRDHRIDVLKLDRSYVRDIDVDPQAERLVTAVLGLARELGLAVTAEGVESASQADRLAAAGARRGQGYLWARPMPEPVFRQWLRERRSGRPQIPSPRVGRQACA